MLIEFFFVLEDVEDRYFVFVNNLRYFIEFIKQKIYIMYQMFDEFCIMIN